MPARARPYCSSTRSTSASPHTRRSSCHHESSRTTPSGTCAHDTARPTSPPRTHAHIHTQTAHARTHAPTSRRARTHLRCEAAHYRPRRVRRLLHAPRERQRDVLGAVVEAHAPLRAAGAQLHLAAVGERSDERGAKHVAKVNAVAVRDVAHARQRLRCTNAVSIKTNSSKRIAQDATIHTHPDHHTYTHTRICAHIQAKEHTHAHTHARTCAAAASNVARSSSVHAVSPTSIFQNDGGNRSGRWCRVRRLMPRTLPRNVNLCARHQINQNQTKSNHPLVYRSEIFINVACTRQRGWWRDRACACY
jgi:hypothetical protein